MIFSLANYVLNFTKLRIKFHQITRNSFQSFKEICENDFEDIKNVK